MNYGTTYINNCQFINNTVVPVYNYRGKAYIHNSSFIDNKAVPVMSTNYATVLTTVTDSKFYGNSGTISTLLLMLKTVSLSTIPDTGVRSLP